MTAITHPTLNGKLQIPEVTPYHLGVSGLSPPPPGHIHSKIQLASREE
jgi:hypothetical protein